MSDPSEGLIMIPLFDRCKSKGDTGNGQTSCKEMDMNAFNFKKLTEEEVMDQYQVTIKNKF
jgi:hypothetical protein